MTRVIAFSGIGNTGKSTIIDKLEQKSINLGMNCKVYKEIANDIAQKLYGGFSGIPNITRFQKVINVNEYERVMDIKTDIESGLYDLILCDRTFKDQELYYTHNLRKGFVKEISMLPDPGSRDIYNDVIVFDTQIVSDPNFEHYNDRSFNERFVVQVLQYYSKLYLMRNGKYNEREILSMLG